MEDRFSFDDANAVNIAYLVNQGPQTSHSFIRREILGLEALGHRVARFTLRRSEGDLPDPGDQAERARTRVVLGVGPLGLAWATVREAATRPGGFFKTLALTVREGRRSDRGLLRHFVCLAESCVLAHWLRADGIEHLHAHFGTNSAAVAMMTGCLTGIPYSFTVHGPEEFDRAPGLGLAEKLRHARFAITISEFGRGQLMRWTRSADWPRIHIVHCGLDAAFLDTPITPPPAGPRVVCVGRLVEQKAQLVLVEAAAILKSHGVRMDLRLVGDGPMRPEIESLIAARQLGDRVTILGWKGAAEVRQEILAARLVAQPSLAEGLPVAVMEAYALGRPVVTTQIAGIPELVDASCGWLVPAGSPEKLADALAAALGEASDRLAALAATGRSRVAKRHRIETEVSKLARILAGG